jgi:hypothetical protein
MDRAHFGLAGGGEGIKELVRKFGRLAGWFGAVAEAYFRKYCGLPLAILENINPLNLLGYHEQRST